MSNTLKTAVTRTNHDWPLLSQSLGNFINQVGLDPSFQRNACWSDANSKQYLKNIIVSQAPSLIVVANLEKCLELSTPGEEDYKYFKKWIDAGYKWLSIDGNNRTLALRNYLNGESSIAHGEISIGKATFRITKSDDKMKTHNPALKEYIDNYCYVTVCEYIVRTRKEVSDLFIAINSGKALKPQEIRNAVVCDFADEIRAMSAKYLVGNKVFKNNMEYKFDELIAKLAVLACSGIKLGVGNTLLDAAYTDNSSVYQHFTSRSLKVDNGKKMVENILKLIKTYAPNKGFKVGNVMNLFMILMELNDKNQKITDEKKFFEWFISTENKRIDSSKVLTVTSRGPQTYANLNGGTQGGDLTHRWSVIVEDLKDCPYITAALVLDSERLFTPGQRYKMWENQGGICPVTGKTIPEKLNDYNLWIFNTEKIN